MYRAAISGIGVEIPEARITNEELVASFNQWVDSENAARAAAGEPLLQKSDNDFILYASGVKERHVLVLDGILGGPRRLWLEVKEQSWPRGSSSWQRCRRS